MLDLKSKWEGEISLKTIYRKQSQWAAGVQLAKWLTQFCFLPQTCQHLWPAMHWWSTVGNASEPQRLVINLMRVLLSQTSPPSASPDSTLAHNSVNYPAVSVRYRRKFCVILRLRPWYQRIYGLYSEAHLARVGFRKERDIKTKCSPYLISFVWEHRHPNFTINPCLNSQLHHFC